VVEGLSTVRGVDGFASDVESSLPFSVVTATDFPNFDHLLMDEHRVLGFRDKGEEAARDKEHCIHVFHMGRPREGKVEARLRSLFSEGKTSRVNWG